MRPVSCVGAGADGRALRRGPLVLFLAWALHDVEEALTFPATCEFVADRTGIESVRMDSRQSWAAVGLMAVVVGGACLRGAGTGGRSRAYRAVVAGLGAHVGTHLAGTVVTRGYTSGVVTALPVMLPGALVAGRELARDGAPLTAADVATGAALLVPAALACHVAVRMAMPGPGRRRGP